MILVAPCDEPRSCPGVNRSIPSTRRPRCDSSRSTALPIAPRPQTTTSKCDISALKIADCGQTQDHSTPSLPLQSALRSLVAPPACEMRTAADLGSQYRNLLPMLPGRTIDDLSSHPRSMPT